MHRYLDNMREEKQVNKKDQLIQGLYFLDDHTPQSRWLSISCHQNRKSQHLLVIPGIVH